MGTAIYSTGSYIYIYNSILPDPSSTKYVIAYNNASLGIFYLANYSVLIMTNSIIYNNTGV